MNSTHYHVAEEGKDAIEADGLREHCDLCREKKGLKPLNAIERKLADAGVLGAKAGESGSASIQQGEALRMLEEQEALNDTLRAENKALRDDVARLTTALAKKQGRDS